MSNWEEQKGEFFQWGILPIDEVPHDVLYYLKNKFGDKSHNHELAGHIRKEFAYENWPNFVEEFIIEKAGDPFLDRLMEKYQVLSSSRPFKLKSLWVNLQKKHEFNPIHTHSGDYSFVLFVDIPFDIEDEKICKNAIRTSEKDKSNGMFTFSYPDSAASRAPISNQHLNIDRSWEGTMFLFPANLAHSVNPFYTSNDYRVTISGNVIFEFNEEDEE